MRAKKVLSGLNIFLFLCGIATFCVSVFAIQLGIDNDPGWGKGRIFLFIISLLSFASLLVIHYRKALEIFLNKTNEYQSRVKNKIYQTVLYKFFCRIFEPIVRLHSKMRLSIPEKAKTTITVSLACIMVILTYQYFITVGTFKTWIPYSHYYDRLAEAFLAGQVNLLEQPPTELSLIKDPYNYLNREGIQYLWDATFFQGNYYLYWGPVPAILAALAKLIRPVVIEDQYLLFTFSCGIILIFSLMVTFIRKELFPASSRWLLFFTILMIGLSTPIFWLINRPNVYETAIASSQFFLLLGIYAAIRSIFTKKHEKFWLFVAGFAWGASINSRLSLIFAILWLLFVLSMIKWKQITIRAYIVNLCFLLIPLIIWGLLFSTYNYVRFGNILETGHRYQLTGLAMPADYKDVTSLNYLIPSIYGYLFRPLSFDPESFPFFRASFIAESMWPQFIKIPPIYYYAEPLAGIFYLMPALLYLLIPGKTFWHILREWLNERPINLSKQLKERQILWWTIAIASLLLLFPLLIFISTSMRYLADVAPMLTLLVFIQYSGFQIDYSKKPKFIRFLNTLFFALILLGIVMSILVNFTNGDKRFESLNPAMYYGTLLKIFPTKP